MQSAKSQAEIFASQGFFTVKYGGVCFRVSMHIFPASFRRAPHAEHGTWALEANQANS